ncbi:hypothetical protein N8T08_002648 [Aspergillus melleus]|uniref:Uncharacterized protein n=1 Tax=Aspergillus melleus TaxID=138277 RepID=A0ACC3ALL5_9EURO|nr:hypothetical protein N8T08_002648 [Aspergillus melleus]
MPIKLPKGFTRRKSSGNALEEVETPPQPSFRIFERPSVDKKSMSDGNLLSKRLSSGHPLDSPTDENDNIFAAPLNHPQRQLRLRPVVAETSLNGRTASIGQLIATFTKPLRYTDTSHFRTSSTATPPKLPDTELQIGQMGDEFHNMFDDMGKRRNAAQETSRNGSVDTYSSTPPETGFRKEEKVQRPAPINTDRSKEVEPSPYSWGSRHSEEGLLAAVDSPHEEPPATYSGFTPYRDGRRKSLPLSNAAPITTTTHRSLEKPEGAAEKGLRRSVLYPNKRDSTPVEDEDAKLIMSSLYTSRRNSQLPFASDHEDSDAENETPLFTNKTPVSQQDRLTPPPLQPPAHKSPGLNDDHLDPSIAAHARLAVQYEKTPAPMPSTNKVMTPSQFEHYRQQQELRRSKSDASKSEDSEESDFDEEDETEKNREAEKQRRKQEAHLSVYRQQMMKVTGQQSPAPSLRPEMDRASNSAPNLTAQAFNQGNRSGSGKSSEGDEDEEVPLGILAAHGFPNRNRPPSRLAMSNSIPNLRASFHQPYISSPGSVAENDAGNRSSLPVFARNLPRDPYYGAGLVNPSNRESLAFGGGASVYGGPSAPTGPPPGLPPGGLIGVIATEERARAMRRRSPNTQAMHDFNAAMPSVPTHPNGIPRPYTMMSLNPPNVSAPQQGVTATEQAQIQLSQQMSSMMQMQMQWMQQMIHMQGGQGPPPQQPMPTPMPPGGFPPAAASPTMRPSSMPSAGPNNLMPPAFGGDQRTFSLLDPNASSRLNAPAMPYASGANRPSTPAGQGYAPSIAPSERSNVGLAPRYRPVSTLQPDTASAAYPLASKPWNDENQRSSVSIASPVPSQMPKPTPRPISNGGKSALARGPGNGIEPDDEDDDEGWAEMMKKRENKRSNWKSKKETSSLGDLLNTVH